VLRLTTAFAISSMGVVAGRAVLLPDTKGRYKFPFGDFKRVHRCAVLSAESRTGQYKHLDVERAAALLHEMIDGKKHKVRAASA
jgi:hypothetical protein